MSSIYVIYRVDLQTFNVDGICTASNRSQALSSIKQSVNDYIVTEEGVKRANWAFEILEKGSDEKDGILIKYVDEDKNSIEVFTRTKISKQNNGWMWSTQEEEIKDKPLFRYGYTVVVKPESAIDIPVGGVEVLPVSHSPSSIRSLMSYGKEKDHGLHAALISQLKSMQKSREALEGGDILEKVEENLKIRFEHEQERRRKTTNGMLNEKLILKFKSEREPDDC
jgi:hypothetical protein